MLSVTIATAYDAVVSFTADVRSYAGNKRVMLRGVTADDADGVIIDLLDDQGESILPSGPLETVCFGYKGGNVDLGVNYIYIYQFDMLELTSDETYTIEVTARTICMYDSSYHYIGCRSYADYSIPYYCWGECTTTEANNVYYGSAGQGLNGQGQDCDTSREGVDFGVPFTLVNPNLDGTGPITITADFVAP